MDERFDLVVLGKNDDTSRLNRALLSSARDVLIVPDGAAPGKSCLDELVRAGKAHDRIAAVIPVPHDADLADGAERAGNQLPVTVDVPGPDAGCVLLKAEVLKMAGALDPAFASPREALTDWCLRAQRLGYVTVRALRAWFRAGVPAAFAGSSRLDERHESYALQRAGAERDCAARLPYQALSLARGQVSICLDVRYLLEDKINGSGVYAVELGRALAEHTPAQVMWLVASEGQRRALARLGLRVWREDEPMPAFDLVHRPSQVFWPRDLPWLLHAQAPMVITYQDLIAYRVPTAFPRPEEHALYREVSHLSVRSAQAVIAISEHNRREIVGELQVPEDHVAVVHHGVSTERFAKRQPDAGRLLRSLGVPERFFLYVGSDYAHKNLRLLLAAYASLRARWPGPEPAPSLVLAGHASSTAGGVFPRLREAAPPGVVYLGQVADATLEALYQQTLALLFVSAYEGFGLPILEAMAAGAPVLCSRASSIPEVAGDAACFADDLTDLAIGRKMLELATRQDLRQDLAARGARRAAAFTWAEAARKTFAVYERAIRAPSSRSLQERRIAAGLATRLFASPPTA